ncbi:hypothetical protein C8R43DRAFT_1235748, partial [Mycena crocata]
MQIEPNYQPPSAGFPSTSAMFPPFENVTDFYPGLIAWCDPHYLETDTSMSALKMLRDRKKSRELRPCLVISADYNNQTFQAARLSAEMPSDPTRWTKIDSPPPITWKLNDAWIWVATPPTIPMVFDNAKIMHPNKDVYYSTHPVATTNLYNYGVHRQAYMNGHLASRGLFPTLVLVYLALTRKILTQLRMLDIVLKVPTRNTVSVILIALIIP